METKISIKIRDLLSISVNIRSFEIIDDKLILVSEDVIKSNAKFSVMTSEQYAQIYYHTIIPRYSDFYRELYYYMSRECAQQLYEIWNGVKSPGYDKIINIYDHCSEYLNKKI